MAETTVEEKVEENQDQQNQDSQEDSKTQAQSVELSEAVPSENEGPGTSINILLDMPVPITVTVGQTEVFIQQILQFAPGSVLRLDKPIEAPVDLYLKDTRFATGDVVVVDNKFAVKIKEILAANPAAGAAN